MLSPSLNLYSHLGGTNQPAEFFTARVSKIQFQTTLQLATASTKHDLVDLNSATKEELAATRVDFSGERTLRVRLIDPALRHINDAKGNGWMVS